jgi:superfamily I DNA and/or RNA helicase
MLPLRWLHPRGRLIVTGDHLQLPPIVKEQNYPEVKHGAVLYGSFLQAMLRDVNPPVINPFRPFDAVRFPSHLPSCIKLSENYRMCNALNDLTRACRSGA